MKSINTMTLLILIAPFSLSAQSVGLGYSGANTLLIDCTWTSGKLAYQLGFGIQKSDAVGKKVDERKSNYGLEETGKGDSYVSLDFGIGFRPTRSIKIILVGSVGQREYFTNFSDHRFSGGGYHTVDKTSTVSGLGISTHFAFTANWGIEVGYNSLHGALAAIHYIF